MRTNADFPSQWVEEESYYGLGSEKKQAESDEFLIKDADLYTWSRFVRETGPWNL